jgi:hypothetical protein
MPSRILAKSAGWDTSIVLAVISMAAMALASE